MDIVLESLKFYQQRMLMISYRVTSVMKPYLEAIFLIGCSCEVTWILYGFRSGGAITVQKHVSLAQEYPAEKGYFGNRCYLAL